MPERKKKINLRSKDKKTLKKAKTSAKKIVSKRKADVRKSKSLKAEASLKKAQVKSRDAAIKVYDLKGKVLETINIDPIFQGHVHTDLIYQAILMYRAGEREGTASTKDRGHVRGGGKKPWKQKGTGQARHGSRRSPIWKGGGTTFGPMPRDYSYSLPESMRKKALAEVLKEKVQTEKFLVLDRIQVDAPKTKCVAALLEALKLNKPLFVMEKRDKNFDLAARNIQAVDVKMAREINALDVANAQEFVIGRSAYDGLLKRLKSE